ncbi:MAG: efflux RND transporter periplasmic adaptor subunit [Planctomycetes bacterium]|nr:efflux RND transporter periplasmic adaptor subunit [Planctomycetota bacterium]
MNVRHNSSVFLLAILTSAPGLHAQPGPTKVAVTEARIMRAPSTMVLVASVEPVRKSRVGSEIAGLVEVMPVHQGDFVKKGDALCRLDSATLRHRAVEAKARLSVLQSAHEELLAGTRKDELVRLGALRDEAVEELKMWEFEFARVNKLHEGRESNRKELVEARTLFRTAERRMIAAKARYDLGSQGPRKEVIAQARYEVAEQQAVVDRTATELEKTTIRAPFDGYVVRRNVEVGEWVTVGGQIVEMVDLSSMLVRVNVPESALPFLHVGDRTRIEIDALARFFEGKVKHIMRDADRTARTFPVEIEIPNDQKLLAGGMFARATVTVGDDVDVVAVPKDAVVERRGITQVGVVVPGERGGFNALLVSVILGSDIGDWIAITSGNIEPGDKIVTHGTERIHPFPTAVLIVDKSGTPIENPMVTKQ